MNKFSFTKKVLFEIISVLLVAVSGVFFVRYTWLKTENEEFQNALQIAKSISILLPLEDIKKLETTPSDIDKPQYKNLKRILKSIINVNKESRFAYIYSERNGKILINVDSEPEDSKDYSPPGQEYTEADSAYKFPFINGNDFLTNPVVDRWGTWRSVLIPIKDSVDGKIIAVYAMDFDAKKWNNQLIYEVSESSLLLVLFIFALIISIRIVSKNSSLNNEIKERKNIEVLLKQTRQNYETYFNTIDEFLFVLDEKGNIIHANATVINRLGYSWDELSGKSVLTIHPIERRDEAGRIVGEMLNGITEFCPVPLITKSGIQIPVETRVSHGYWNDNPVIFGVTKDISKIQFSEEKFSKVFYLNPSACGLSDSVTHKYIEVNEAFYTLFGFDKSEVIGKTAMELGILSIEKFNEIAILINSGVNLGNENVYNLEVDLKTKNGDTKHVLMSAENINVQDKIYRYTVVHDITERKQAEIALQESEKRSKKQRESVVSLSIEESIISGNVPIALQKLTKVLSDTVSVDRASVWSLSDDGMKMICLCLYEASNNEYSQGTVLNVTDFPNYFKTIFTDSIISADDAQSDPRTNEFTDVYLKPLGITSMLDAGIWIEGKPIGVVCFEHVGEKRSWHAEEEAFANTAATIIMQIYSNADRKLAAENLKTKNEQLEKANAEKDKLFSIIAHDLRSPFTAFLGYTEIMVEDAHKMTSDNLQKIAVSIHNSANNLFRLLTNLLEWSMVQRGLIVFKPETIILSKLISHTLEVFYEIAKKKEIEIITEIPENISVIADVSMFETIIRNLISNALKFTMRGGSVFISAKEKKGIVEVSVKDSGIGMSKKMVDNLFKINNQMSRPGTEKELSSGLGLLLCKEFVEKQNGKIWVESEEGKGSTFYFSI